VLVVDQTREQAFSVRKAGLTVRIEWLPACGEIPPHAANFTTVTIAGSVAAEAAISLLAGSPRVPVNRGQHTAVASVRRVFVRFLPRYGRHRYAGVRHRDRGQTMVGGLRRHHDDRHQRGLETAARDGLGCFLRCASRHPATINGVRRESEP
jgi:hypothetical protein